MRHRRILSLTLSCLLTAGTGALLVAETEPGRLPLENDTAIGSKPAAPQPTAPPTSGLNFASPVLYGSGGYGTYSVAVADLTGGGVSDLVAANFCYGSYDFQSGCPSGVGGVSVLLGNGGGTGSFQNAVAYSTGGLGASSVAIADLTRTGVPDIVVVNSGRGNNDASVGVLLGNGDGTFRTSVTYPAGDWAFYIAVGDVNGDGIPDLVVANYCVSSANCTNGVVQVLLGNGDGTFQTAVTYSSGGAYAFSIALGDVNGDGKPDIVVSNTSSGTVGVLLNNGNGTFQTAVTYSSGGAGTYTLALGDVNGDGKPDIVVAEQGNGYSGSIVGVLLNNGDGTFKPAVTYGSGGQQAASVVLADVNEDGPLDIVVTNLGSGNPGQNDSVVGVLLGNGDGTFQTAVAFDTGVPGIAYASVAIADVNGDGKPDLLATNYCANPVTCTDGRISLLLNSSLYTSLPASATAMISSVNPSNYGQAVNLTASISHQQGTSTPTGTVSFFDGMTNIGSSSLNFSGVGTLAISTLAVGTHYITATYSGDSDFQASTSAFLRQVVLGTRVALSPTALTFGNQGVGVASTSQIVTLMNSATNVGLTIASIGITGSNSGDFAQTNNCPGTVPANSGCNISVTFTPSAVGSRNALITITDNGLSSPQSAPLTGTGGGSANLYSPANGSTLAGNAATFAWSNYAGATAYWLDLGATQGGNTYLDSGSLSSSTLSYSVTSLPTDGSTVWARWYYLVSGTWQYTDYTYVAFGASASRGVINSPNPGSTLTGSGATFAWSAGSGAIAYWLDVGSTAGGHDYYTSGNLGNVFTQTVTTLPVNGSAVYMTLYSLVSGTWFSNQYTYTAYNLASAGGMMQTPAPGTVFANNTETFTWSAGSGAAGYWIDLGSTTGGHDIYSSGNLGNVLTATVHGLPTDGSTVYVTLYTLISGAWSHNAYTYQALNATAGVATMQTPPQGSTLSGPSITFTWSSDSNATGYWVDIGAAGPGSHDLDSSGHLNVTTETVYNLPANGSAIYVTLYSYVGGQWLSKGYTYTSGP